MRVEVVSFQKREMKTRKHKLYKLISYLVQSKKIPNVQKLYNPKKLIDLLLNTGRRIPTHHHKNNTDHLKLDLSHKFETKQLQMQR